MAHKPIDQSRSHSISRVFLQVSLALFFLRATIKIEGITFYLSPNVVPKPTYLSCSNLIFTVLLQLSLAHPFHFQPTLNIKGTLMLRVVHIKKIKFSFSQKRLQRFLSTFVGLLYIRIPTMTLSAFPGKIPETGKTYFKFFSVS